MCKVGGCGYGLRQPVHGSHRVALGRGAPHQRDERGVQVGWLPLRQGDQPLAVPGRPQLCRAGRDRQRGGERGRHGNGQPASDLLACRRNAAVVSRTSGQQCHAHKHALQPGRLVRPHVQGCSRLSSCQWRSRARRQCPSAAKAPGRRHFVVKRQRARCASKSCWLERGGSSLLHAGQGAARRATTGLAGAPTLLCQLWLTNGQPECFGGSASSAGVLSHMRGARRSASGHTRGATHAGL